jgi:hypothetical protein
VRHIVIVVAQVASNIGNTSVLKGGFYDLLDLGRRSLSPAGESSALSF